MQRLSMIMWAAWALVVFEIPIVHSETFNLSELNKTGSAVESDQPSIAPDALDQLTHHKILITNIAYRQIFEPYINPTRPVFITSDTVIHAFHVLFTESVGRFEEANARNLLDVLKMMWTSVAPEKRRSAANSLNQTPPQNIKSRYAEPDSIALLQAARERAQIVVAVAIKLLGDNSIELGGRLKRVVENEVDRVIKAEGLWLPQWFGKPTSGLTALDYSRFKPHGFYTRSASLERYFRALSWLQSIPFRVDKDEELMAMLLLGKTFIDPYFDEYTKRLEIEKWFRCYRELVGQTNDWDLLLAAQIIRGRPADLDTVRKFLSKPELNVEDGSKINNRFTLLPEFLTMASSAEFHMISPFRLPDTVLFQRTTSLPDFERHWPSGLEVCAVLDSDFALAQLMTRVPSQHRHIFMREIDQLRMFFKTKSFYNQYLSCLAALIDEPEPDVPLFMTRVAWKAKSCSSFLAGWAQQRHSWTLPAKQTVHSFGGVLESLPSGFVEPEPEFFARMGRLVERIQDRFIRCGAFIPPRILIAEDLRTFAKLLEEVRYPPTDEDTHKLTGEEHSVLERSMMILTVLGDFRYSPAEFVTRRDEIVPKVRAIADEVEAGKFDDDPAYQGLILETNVDTKALWQSLEYICRRLEVLAHKQLRGAAFSKPENFFLADFGARLAALMFYSGDSYRTPNDDVPFIVDVYFNPQADGHFHVGVARPRELLVLYPHKDGEILCRGAVLPYYEFVSSRHLTDSEWRKRLDSDERPDNPDWLKPFIAAGDPRKFETENESFR